MTSNPKAGPRKNPRVDARRGSAAMPDELTETSGRGTGNSVPDRSVLDGAIDLIEEAMAIFDGDRRLSYSNAAFLALFPKLTGDLIPGASIDAIWCASVAAGYCHRSSVRTLERAPLRHFLIQPRGPRECQIADGRWLWIKDRPTSDGGMVLLRRDITARMVRDTQLTLAVGSDIQTGWTWNAATQAFSLSPAWLNSLGYDDRTFAMGSDTLLDFVHPEDHDQVRPLLDSIPAGGLDSFDVEFRFRRADGNWSWIRSRGKIFDRDPLLGVAREVVGVQINITREREAEAVAHAALIRARHLEDKLRSALDTIPEGFLLYDADSRLIHCNSAYLSLDPRLAAAVKLGMTQEEVFDLCVEFGLTVLPPGLENEGFASRMRDIEAGGVWRDFKIADGRWFQVIGRRTVDGGYVGLRRDITEAKRQEGALRHALAEAEGANLAKTQFLANMSHELRTPLNAILGFSEIMRDGLVGPISALYSEYAENIYTSGAHLLEIINNILDLSKLTLSSVDLTEDIGDPRDLVEACTVLMRAQMAARRINLVQQLPPSLPLIRVDLTRMKQVLLNLLSNAKKFSPEGGTVIVAVTADQHGLRFAIRDFGIGMSPIDIPLALEAFRQVGDVMTRRQEGTGLGLPLAKAMVEAHGGTLTIESSQGVGTVVTVGLPAARVIWPD